jgi:transposase
MMMAGDDPTTKVAQRFEVFTGAGRRREWPPEVKAAIVAESYSGLESVSAVARRHGLDPAQLFGWRQQQRKVMGAQAASPITAPGESACFVPALVDPAQSSSTAPHPKRRRRQRRSQASVVELEIDGVAVKIAAGADQRLISAVIAALKATR